MSTDLFSDPRMWVDVAQSLVLLVLWLRKPGEQAHVEISHLKAQIAVQEEKLRHTPVGNQVAELEGTVKALAVSIESLQTMLERTDRALERVEQFLRDNR